MPHRLRRVIAINIRNANTKAASQQIAMLDLRTHTMVVGDNGVGKSSFMRLIPLFYGAAPDRILRGTQKSSLIGYTLPTSSSAIAFEYERQNAEDLHLVVVHAKPGVEQAEFCILPSGYREAYFVDSQNQFVERDQFRAHVESMGVTASPRLQLHQYRSVILNERRPTKDGQEMRQLAAKHALGPRSLYGLDMISVAMTGERLSFRDLQNLVLDRLSDTGYEGLRGSNEKALRKSRRDIESWVNHVRHTQRVFGAKDRVKRARDLIVDVRRTALELGSLRAATAKSVAARQADLATTQRAIEVLEKEESTYHEDANATREGLAKGQQDAKAAWEVRKNALEDVVRQATSFDRDGAEDLSGQQDKEEQISYDRLRAHQDLESMVARVGEAEDALRQRLEGIQTALDARLKAIGEQRLSGSEEHDAARSELDAQKESALGTFDEQGIPLRAGELDILIDQERQRFAEQMAHSRTADAPQAAIDNVGSAEAEHREAEENKRRQDFTLGERREAVTVLESEAREIALQLDKAEAEAHAAGERHALLSELLSPPVGSVLEALRGQPLALWEATAKALDPALLLRKDLQPYVDDGLLHAQAEGVPGQADTGAGAASQVQIGPLLLHVESVDLPPWAQEDSAQEQLNIATHVLQATSATLQALVSRSKGMPGRLQEARLQLSLAEAASRTAATTVVEALKLLERARKHVVIERERVRQEHAQLAGDAQTQLTSLQRERAQVIANHDAARKALVRQFSDQINGLTNANAARLARLDQEKAAAVAAAEGDKNAANAQHAQVLAGKGVDPAVVASLRTRVGELDDKLTSIAANKHTVRAWRTFRDELLPQLPRLEQEELQARQEKDDADARINKHESKVREQHAEFLSRGARLNASRVRDSEELQSLQRLLSGLEPYQETGRVDLSEGLHADLNGAAQRELRDLERFTRMLESDTRFIGDLMRERPGAIAGWLDQHEEERRRELGDPSLLQPFEDAVWRARTVIHWFEPSEHRGHLISLRQEMDGYLAAADAFVSEIDRFEERVKTLHNEFMGALRRTSGFRRFGALEVGIASTAGSSPAVKALRQMKDVSQSRVSSWRPSLAGDPTLPDEDEIRLIQDFKEHLPDGGVLQVNLDEQVRLSFRVTEMGKLHEIQNERDMQGLSSTGLTVLITMMFLIGFVEIVRGPNSPVGLAWVLDEVGRVSPTNMIQYLEVLEQQGVTAVCAAPSVDPAIAALFDSVHLFEDDGSISRADLATEEVAFDSAAGAAAPALAATRGEVLQ